MVALDKDERIVTALEEYDNGSLLFFTKSGNVKRSDSKEYVTRVKKVQAISLKENDEVLCVQLLCNENLLLISKQGMSIRFAADTVPETGRVSAGVKCMKLENNDIVLFAMQVGEDGEIITVSDRGYAKRSFVFDYELQGRNGKGLKTFDFKKNGSNGTCIAGAMHVKEPFDIIVEQNHGSTTKLNTEEIAIEQRAGKGTLTVMALLDDVVTSVYKA
jgi:DNA gyrase subunit A